MLQSLSIMIIVINCIYRHPTQPVISRNVYIYVPHGLQLYCRENVHSEKSTAVTFCMC